jgi:hypothetical protein
MLNISLLKLHKIGWHVDYLMMLRYLCRDYLALEDLSKIYGEHERMGDEEILPI